MKTLWFIALGFGLLIGHPAGAGESARSLVARAAPQKMATGKLSTSEIGVEAVHCALEDGLSQEKGKFSFGNTGNGTATSAQ
jgi:hypothetical protein